MSNRIIIYSTILLSLMSLPLFNCKAQTLKTIEDELHEEIIPPPPKECPLRDFWEDSWDEWADGYGWFWGIAYNYTKQFPISFSLQAHRRLLFCGLDLGFSTGKQSYECTVTETYQNITTIINGEETHYSSELNIQHRIKPMGYAAIQPGLNFNFITLAVGLGLCWGEKSRIVTGAGNNINENRGFCGGIITPNAILHIPVIGTDNRVRITLNAGYQFMTVFDIDVNVRRLGANGNGWKFGGGIEILFE